MGGLGFGFSVHFIPRSVSWRIAPSRSRKRQSLTMTTLRRFLVLQLLMLWQGGFLFYASFVVPVGTEVLGSAEAQGLITTRVTDYLNAVGTVGLILFACELLASGGRLRIRWSCWAVAAACQIALFIIHVQLEAMMDPDRTFVVKRVSFYRLHGIYLWVTTIQWVACLVLTWFTLRAWAEVRPINIGETSSGR